MMQVLDFLEENVRATPEALGDMHKESPEERTERHERVVASSLAAMRDVLDVLTPKEPSAPRGVCHGSQSACTNAGQRPTACEVVDHLTCHERHVTQDHWSKQARLNLTSCHTLVTWLLSVRELPCLCR